MERKDAKGIHAEKPAQKAMARSISGTKGIGISMEKLEESMQDRRNGYGEKK